ncbi:MAG: hypothetical protein Q7R52_03545 [archaeon]|nr:hypothetical protein [archaeon]
MGKEKTLIETEELQASEIILIRDEKSGRLLEFHSSKYDVKQLIDFGWMAWQNFFNHNPETIPTGVN